MHSFVLPKITAAASVSAKRADAIATNEAVHWNKKVSKK